MRRFTALALFAVTGLMAGCGASHDATEVTDANFDEFTGDGVALVDFYATWCPPCKTQGPIVEKLATQYKGRAAVGKLDIDKNEGTAREFDVKSIPTLIIFIDGEESQRMVGLRTEEELTEALEAALE